MNKEDLTANCNAKCDVCMKHKGLTIEFPVKNCSRVEFGYIEICRECIDKLQNEYDSALKYYGQKGDICYEL